MSHNIIKRLIVITKILFALLALGVLMVLYANWRIPNFSDKYIYSSINNVPEKSVAIVLGTSQYIGKRENLYFKYRIDAATELYYAGKLDAIVVSGDNKHMSYNEPRDMRKALLKAGVPDSIIYLDYAGFRTLDSMVRMGKVFGQDTFVVISQRFHNERAIFLARHYGYEAFGYNATDLTLSKYSFKTKVRELLARVKVYVDIIFGVKPKFLGEPIEIKPHREEPDSIA